MQINHGAGQATALSQQTGTAGSAFTNDINGNISASFCCIINGLKTYWFKATNMFVISHDSVVDLVALLVQTVLADLCWILLSVDGLEWSHSGCWQPGDEELQLPQNRVSPHPVN